jgi:hypothetical protein
VNKNLGGINAFSVDDGVFLTFDECIAFEEAIKKLGRLGCHITSMTSSCTKINISDNGISTSIYFTKKEVVITS